MNRIWLIIKKDFRKRMKSPAGVLVLMAIPLVMTAVFGAVFAPSGQTALPRISVLLADNDDNFISQMIHKTFQQQQVKKYIDISMVDETRGREMIARDKASALLIIPRGFTRNIIRGVPCHLEMIKNPGQRFLPQVAEEFTETFCVILSAGTLIFREELALLDSMQGTKLENISGLQLGGIFEKVRPKIITLRKFLSPVLISLNKVSLKNRSDKPVSSASVFAQLMPGISILFIMFILETFLRETLTEKEDGTLQRLLFSPTSPSQYAAAKIFSAWAAGMVVTAILTGVSTLIFGLEWGNLLFLSVFNAVTIFGLCGLFTLLNSFFHNKNQAGAVTAPVILVLSAFGGSMIPVSQLPRSLQRIGMFSPNFWFIKGSQQIQAHAFPLVPCLIFLAAGIVFSLLGTHIMAKRISP